MIRNPNYPTLYCIDFNKGFVKGNVIVISQFAMEIVKMLAAPSDKRAKKIWGKTLSEMSPEEGRVAKAEMDQVAAFQKHGEASPEHLAATGEAAAAREAAKKASCPKVFWA